MKTKVARVWIDENSVYIETDRGKVYSEKFADYPRLRHATPVQRANFEFDNIGIRWDVLDEDLSFNGFICKRK